MHITDILILLAFHNLDEFANVSMPPSSQTYWGEGVSVGGHGSMDGHSGMLGGVAGGRKACG